MEKPLEVGQSVQWDTSGENCVHGRLDGDATIVAVRTSSYYPRSKSLEYDIKLAKGPVLIGVHESVLNAPRAEDGQQQTVWASSDTYYEEILLLDPAEQVEMLKRRIKEIGQGDASAVCTSYPEAVLSDFRCMLRAREGG